ncbi:hypothetical protein MBUL_04470 (plasmid) [Methylobacterium bullatum]|uniref:HTH cro/C1-type domain-containing protein n=1 Tax=Methylobacterium bullatum TaxID=570505 RepID=A0A679JNR2_9HYPH|nr:hypothetical protein MBUL_04470 [Methylobacterium bullatum]
MGEKYISPAQCRAARALLEWTREDLAAASGVSKMTLADFETGKRKPYARTLFDVREALEHGGVFLMYAGEGDDPYGAGVRYLDQEGTTLSADVVRQILKR